jgi:hypothetical protein
MKKKTNFLLIIIGVILFVPFQYYKFVPAVDVSEQILHFLGVAAMLGIIIIMIALLNLSSKIELKIVNKNNCSNDNDKEFVK